MFWFTYNWGNLTYSELPPPADDIAENRSFGIPRTAIFSSLKAGSGHSDIGGKGVGPGWTSDSAMDVLPSMYLLKLSRIWTEKQDSIPINIRILNKVNLETSAILEASNDSSGMSVLICHQFVTLTNVPSPDAHCASKTNNQIMNQYWLLV